ARGRRGPPPRGEAARPPARRDPVRGRACVHARAARVGAAPLRAPLPPALPTVHRARASEPARGDRGRAYAALHDRRPGVLPGAGAGGLLQSLHRADAGAAMKKTWAPLAALLMTAAVVALDLRFALHAGGLWRDEAATAHFATLPTLGDIASR